MLSLWCSYKAFMGSSTGVRSLEHTPLNASLFMTAPRVAARTFQDLVVWRKAHELVLAVYSLTAGFPKEETYGLALQMRRAAVSVPANIAEGFRRRGKADKPRYMNMAEASLEERDRKSTRLNSSHTVISYAVFCLKKKKYTAQ